MKILVCGAYGRLGAECAVLLAGNHDVVAVDADELDITDKAAVITAVREVQPDWILNCAAYTDVDGCETDDDAAWRLNVQGPENLAAAADLFDGRLLHMSADHVFDGGRPLGHAYSEEDMVSPESVYGRTMAAGEEAVLQFPGNRNCVVRTSWLYGGSGRNFLKTMLGLTLKNPCQPVQVVADQYGAPTWTATLAGQIKILLETEADGGIYHATAEGYCSWYDLGVYFLKQMDLMHALTPCTTVEYPTPAPRPKNAILDNSRLKAAGLHCLRSWQDDVDRFVDQHRQALMEECLPFRPGDNRIC